MADNSSCMQKHTNACSINKLAALTDANWTKLLSHQHDMANDFRRDRWVMRMQTCQKKKTYRFSHSLEEEQKQQKIWKRTVSIWDCQPPRWIRASLNYISIAELHVDDLALSTVWANYTTNMQARRKLLNMMLCAEKQKMQQVVV